MTQPVPQAGGFGLTRTRFGLLFAVMLVAAAGNTAMQSLMPSIGRALQIPDLWMVLGFSGSAILWVVAAPYWARRADKRGRRALMRLGLIGFISSFLICGAAMAVGLAGLAAPMAVFVVFIFGRCLYGAYGSASPPAVQAYIAARTEGQQRTGAVAAIASSFGIGTIFGPAVAPLFIIAPFGLAGPLFAFALIGILVLVALATMLPDDTPTRDARGPISAYPTIGLGDGGKGVEDDAEEAKDTPLPRLRWTDARVFRWHVAGLFGGHGQAAVFGVVGFFVIDRLSLQAIDAQHEIAIVMIGGAVATLLAQWWLIPQLGLDPRQLVAWGAAFSAVGAIGIALSWDLYSITLANAVNALGFGFFRPGFTAGASLAVARHEQNAVAGMVTSVNGAAFIVGPAVGVGLYQLDHGLPFYLTGLLMAGFAVWAWFFLNPSARAD